MEYFRENAEIELLKMNLEEFIQKCESKAIEEGNQEYTQRAICSLGKTDCQNIMGYVREVVEGYFQKNNLSDNLSKLRFINNLIDESQLNEEELCRHKLETVSDYQNIAIGCLTTIGEELQHQYHKEGLGECDQDFLYFDIPEGLDFTGILAGSPERTAFFRFIKIRVKGTKAPELGRPGFNAGLYGNGVHISGKET